MFMITHTSVLLLLLLGLHHHMASLPLIWHLHFFSSCLIMLIQHFEHLQTLYSTYYDPYDQRHDVELGQSWISVGERDGQQHLEQPQQDGHHLHTHTATHQDLLCTCPLKQDLKSIPIAVWVSPPQPHCRTRRRGDETQVQLLLPEPPRRTCYLTGRSWSQMELQFDHFY